MSLNIKKLQEQAGNLNKRALEHLYNERYKESLNSLKEALNIIKKISDENFKNQILCITLNNLGNLFKKLKNFSESLKYFLKTVALEENLGESSNGTIALAHLSICALRSQRSEHTLALRNGLRAIFLLQKASQTKPKFIPPLVTAYYSIGTEYKILGDTLKADNYYKIGYKVSNELLGPRNTLTIALKNCLLTTKRNSQDFQPAQNDSFSPAIKLPFIPKFRSISDTRSSTRWQNPTNNIKNNLNTTNPNKNITFYNTKNKYDNPYHKKFQSDEETSAKTNKSKTYYKWKSKIDLSKHKATEKTAAIMIQSWWRGTKDRILVNELKIIQGLAQAESKVKQALEEYESFKKKAEIIKKKIPKITKL
jgi:tetratricopeptide (TPR) repeat protein